MSMYLPKVNLEKLEQNMEGSTDEEKEIVGIVVKKNGQIRATKPKVKSLVEGKAAYVWRMVAFLVSSKPEHQCIPVTADFDIEIRDENGRWDVRAVERVTKELKRVEDAIVNAVPKEQWHGVHRWKTAMYGI